MRQRAREGPSSRVVPFMLASSPASALNRKSSRFGIPRIQFDANVL
jgi:hypothetical protein